MMRSAFWKIWSRLVAFLPRVFFFTKDPLSKSARSIAYTPGDLVHRLDMGVDEIIQCIQVSLFTPQTISGKVNDQNPDLCVSELNFGNINDFIEVWSIWLQLLMPKEKMTDYPVCFGDYALDVTEHDPGGSCLSRDLVF